MNSFFPQQQGGMQNQGTIKNPSTGVPKVKGPEFNDRDIVNDALAMEKYLTDSYNTFVREASHQALHQIAMNNFADSHNTARELYNVMFAKGWYELSSASRQEVSQAQQKFSNYQSQFPDKGFGMQ